jgi:hypothetical protein
VFSDPAPLQAEPLAPNEREAALLNGDSPECHKPIAEGATAHGLLALGTQSARRDRDRYSCLRVASVHSQIGEQDAFVLRPELAGYACAGQGTCSSISSTPSPRQKLTTRACSVASALVDAGRTLADQVPRCSCDRDAVDSRGRTSFSIVIVAPAALLSQPWQCHVHEYAHGRCARVRQLRTDGLRGRFEAPDVRQMTLSSRTPMAL